MRNLVRKSLVALATAALCSASLAQIDWQPVTQETLNNPDPGDWPSKRRTPNSWGFSPLTQINTDNVDELELAWAFDVGVSGTVEWTPIVVDGVMFVQGNNTRVVALDAASGDLIWVYEYRMMPAEQMAELGVGGGATSRGLTVYEDKVIAHFGDSHIVALDAATGQEVWKTFTDGLGYTSPGIIANGVLISGNRAKNFDRAFATGIDTETGEILWRTHVIPGAGEPGYETWEVEGTAEIGHGSIWMTPSYDPELDLVYISTGNPDPYTVQTRPGDNLYTNSTLALRPDTGEMVWYHQYIPNDSWDQDSVNEAVLVDLEIDGEMVKALIHTGKSGFTNVLNRETGEYIQSRFLTYQNIFLDVDPETGRPTKNPEVVIPVGDRVIACPSTRGGTDWPARAYSPETGLYYISGNHVCMDVEGFAFEQGTPLRNIDDRRVVAPGYDYIGELWAIDPVTMETVWTVQYDIPTSATPLPTAGGVVFAGHIDRRFFAYDAASGDELWSIRTSAPIEGHPVSYEVDGVQYVAVPVGCCSIVGGAMAREFTPEHIGPSGTGEIWVFRLPEDIVAQQ